MKEKLIALGKIVKVESVIRKNGKVVRVRIQYIYIVDINGMKEVILHDAEFVPVRLKNGRRWVKIAEPRIVGGFIPKNRYILMAKKAAAIIYDKRLKTAEQLQLWANE